MEIGEGLKKIFLAGVGAVAATAENAKDLIDTLVEKGELTVAQGKALNEELKYTAAEKVKQHVTVTVTKSYADAMEAVEHMSEEELSALKEKIRAAEDALGKETDSAAPDDTSSTEGTDPACGSSENNGGTP